LGIQKYDQLLTIGNSKVWSTIDYWEFKSMINYCKFIIGEIQKYDQLLTIGNSKVWSTID